MPAPALHQPAPPSPALVPLLHAALLFLGGIALSRAAYFRPGLLLASLLPLAILAIFAILKTPRLAWLPLATVWVLLGTWSAETEPSPAPAAALAPLADGLLRTVQGTVVAAGPLRLADFGEEEEPPAASTSQLQQIDLQVSAVEVVTDTSDQLSSIPDAETARLRLSIRAATGFPAISCGQQLTAVVRFLPPDTFHDPGVWSRAAYLESQEIAATGSLNPAETDAGQPRLTRASTAPTRSVPCLLNGWRNAASIRIQSLPALTRWLPRSLRASPEDAAMLDALLVGDRTYLTRSLRVGFERTGSFHLVIVSGLHLAILAGCVFSLVRRLRLPQLPATAVTIAVTLAYACFTGFAVPAQRAFWMITLYLIGRLLYRNRSPLNVIGFATLCLLAASPRSLFDASLQMTLLSVAAIAGIAIPLLERTLHARIRATENLRLISLDPTLPPKIAQLRVTLRILAQALEQATSPRIAWTWFPFAVRSLYRLGELLFVTLVVELALALPMAIYFHRITVYALPVNLLILPLLGLLLPAAMLLLLVLALWPAAAFIPAAACLAALHLSVAVVQRLGALAFGDLRIPEPGTTQIAVAAALFVAAILFVRAQTRLRRCALVLLLLMAAVSLVPRPVEHPANALLFQAIDVGQGDSLLLITPDGKTLLVDAGGLGFTSPQKSIAPHTSSQTSFDIGEEVVSTVLWSRGIRRLDAVALTHAHHDHMGGLPAILRNFRPRQLWVGSNPPIPAYTDLLKQASDLGIELMPLHAGDSISFGSATMSVLAPAASYQPGVAPSNNDSLVLQARYGATSLLLEGDAEAPEEDFLRTGPGLSNPGLASPGLASSVLKVGHHGSLTSTGPAFLAQVAPQWAVISCGRRNRFGHPRPEILAELQTARVRTFRTDIDGTTCLLLDGKSVTAEPMCMPSKPASP